MKKIFFTILISMFSTLSAQAVSNWDGCYQLYVPGSMYPAVCLSGTNEEGINGSGVKMVIFNTNSDRIAACSVSSSLRLTSNSLEFYLGASKEMAFSDVKTVNGRLEGKAIFGKTQLNFIQIGLNNSQRLLAIHASEPKCANIEAGSIQYIPRY